MKLSLHLDKYGIDYMEVTFLLSCPNTTRKSKHFYFLCLMQTTFCLSRKGQSTQVSWVKRWLQWPSKSTVPHAWIQPISDQKYMFFFYFQKLSKCKIWICHTPATIYFHMVLVVRIHQQEMGLIPGLGRSPGEGHGNSLQYSCLGRGSWWVIVHWIAKHRTWLNVWAAATIYKTFTLYWVLWII